MSRLLPAKMVAVTAVLLTAPACTHKKPPPAAVVVDDGAPGAAGDEGATEPSTGPKVRPEGKPIQLRASVEGLGDLLALVKQATTAWNPKNPIDASAWIQAALLQFGYGPGMWNALDLGGIMAVDTAFHPEIPTADLRLIGSVAATNPKAIMEGMPSGRRPQPLGNGLWELIHGDLRMVLREQPKALEFALTQPELERAAGLVTAAAGGRRLKVHAADLPPGMLSADTVQMLPAGLRRQVSAVLREATTASIEMDAGTDRDLILELAAEAPFERLGLSPLGAARTATTGLEGKLPAGAALVVAMPWGSPELLHKMVDNAQKQASQLGGAFETQVKSVISASHSVLDQVQNDVVFAVYPGPRGEMTLLIAADVKDEAATRKAAHEILMTANAAVTAFNALGGDKKEASFTVTLKDKGIKSGAVEGELFTVGLPKNMAQDLGDARPLLTSKDQLELAAVVAGGSAVVTIGFDARKLASDVADGLKGARKTSLAANGGLVLARVASKGCHFCVGVDPVGLARVAMFADKTMRNDKARNKQLDAAATVVARIGGALGFGLRLEAKKGALAGGLKKSLLVLSPADAAQVGKLWESMAPVPAADDKPLSGSR